MILDFNRSMNPARAFDEEAFALIRPSENLLGRRDGFEFSDLTIALLPSGDCSHVRRMLDALSTNMPAFGGEIIVLEYDGASQNDGAQIGELLPGAGVRYFRLAAGSPDADARNLAISVATKTWIWFLDPRTILSWNPLPMAEEDLHRSGAHFLNLPRVDTDGRCLSRYRIAVVCRNGSMEVSRARAEDCDNAPAMGIDSASLIARLDTLSEVGGFLSGASAAEADIDLARRLHMSGRKVAVSRAVAIYGGDLSADSPEAREPAIAITREVVGVEEYVAPHGLRSLGQLPTNKVPTDSAVAQTRPKIALVIDVDNWAFGNIARQLCRYLSDRFEFIVIPIGIVANPVRVLLIAHDCQLIHYFWREDPVQLNTAYVRDYVLSLGFRWETFYRRYVASKCITTSVYDHLLLDPKELEQRRGLYTELLAGYTVSSKRLDDIYRRVNGYPAPSLIAEDGVDLTLFKPRHIERLASVPERELVIGWAGNSKWEATREDFKGLHTILQPAVDELQRDGFPVTTYYADRQIRFIPHAEMPDYYSKIDVYVCPSKIEGTPNPVLEAMACGVPVVSTDVGVVPQVFGALQQQFILPERSKDALKTALIRLLDQPKLLVELSNENLESIKAWDWSVKAENFARFFGDALARRQSRSE